MIRRVLGAMTAAAMAGMGGAGVVAAGDRALPRFGAEVEVVTVNVAVTDPRSREFVTGLDADSFRVFEDGVPQQLCLFERERLPIEVSLLLDSSHSMSPRLAAVKAAALRLVRTLRPGDAAEVYHFNHRVQLAQELTSDQDALAAAVDALRADGATGLYTALYSTLKSLRPRKVGEPRRRAVVILTDGADTSSLVSDDQVLKMARASDATVYAIALSETREPGDADPRATYFLTAVTRDTGGRVFFPRKLEELDGTYDRIADELRTQYTLGYVSSNAQRDGAWRTVAVHTPEAGSLLRHRAGYYAPRGRRARSFAVATLGGRPGH